jgi:hypothetical protein
MPLSLDLTYPTPQIDCPQEGDVTAGDLGAHAGGFRNSWFYPVASALPNETAASSDATGNNSGGMATIRHMWGYGTVWRRGMVLLRQGLLVIIDDASLGPSQQASGQEYIAGPVFAMSSGSGAAPHKLPSTTQSQAANSSQSSYWDLRQFANNDSLLVVMAGAELANSTSCNIMAGASSCRPDAVERRCAHTPASSATGQPPARHGPQSLP